MTLSDLLDLPWGVQVNRASLPAGFFGPDYNKIFSGLKLPSDNYDGGTVGRCLYVCMENLVLLAERFATAEEALENQKARQFVQELAGLTANGHLDLQARIP